MFCRKCGTQITGSGKFCPSCGFNNEVQGAQGTNGLNQFGTNQANNLNQAGTYQANNLNQAGRYQNNGYQNNPYQNNGYQNNVYQPGTNQNTGYQNNRVNPVGMASSNSDSEQVASAVQHAGSHISVLLAGIFGLVGVGIPIINILYLMIKYDIDFEYMAGTLFGTILGSTLLALVSIGLILIFSSSKKGSRGTAGYSMINVVCVIKIVLISIIGGIFALVLTFGIITAVTHMNRASRALGFGLGDVIEGLGIGDEVGGFIVACIIILSILVAAFIMFIKWNSKLMSTMKLAKSSLSGRPLVGNNVSAFVFVMKIIGLVFESISVIATIFGARMLSGLPSGVTSMLGIGTSSAIAGIAKFLFGLFYVIALINAKGIIGSAMYRRNNY